MKQTVFVKIQSYQNWILFLGLLVFVLFFRYGDFLFFTWDQGRDAFKLAEMASGDLTLIGPTSGIQGFFLGPLWYYVGLPGFIISRGNPYLLSLWYSLLSLLTIPGIYLVLKKLFPLDHRLSWWGLWLIFFSPGFIKSATMIWNPLLSVPLLAWAIYALFHEQAHSRWIFIGFSLLGLLLQTEFAYGVFLVVGLFLGLKWYQPQAKIKDYVLAGLGVAWTLIPQLLFELKNNWLISRSLLSNINSSEGQVSWHYLAQYRPNQIWGILSEQLWGNAEPASQILIGILILVSLYFCIKLISAKELTPHWRLVYLILFLPLSGYSIWKGNYGNLFSYYVTPHFIPLYLVLLHLLVKFPRIKLPDFNLSFNQILLVLIIFINIRFNLNRILQPKLDSGLTNSLEAIAEIYHLAQEKSIDQPIMRIFVPNRETEHYDYLTKWYAQQHQLPIAKTVLSAADQDWYVLVEPDRQLPKKRFLPWYKKVTANGFLTHRETQGILTIEEWQKL